MCQDIPYHVYALHILHHKYLYYARRLSVESALRDPSPMKETIYAKYAVLSPVETTGNASDLRKSNPKRVASSYIVLTLLHFFVYFEFLMTSI